MEDKNLNPRPLEEIPEDMPALDLDSFANQTPMPEEPELEPLFESGEPAGEVLPEPAPAAEAPEESALEIPAVPAEEILAEEPAAPEQTAEPALPGEGWEDTVVIGVEDIPRKDFSQFDVPVEDDEPAQEEPQPAPAVIYPAEDADTYSYGEEIPGEAAAAAFGADALSQAAFGGEGLEPAYEEQPVESAFEDDGEFAQMFEGGSDASAPAADPAQTARPVRKARPRRKKGDGLLGIPHLLATFVWLAIILAIGVSLGRMLWLCAADVLAFGRESKDVVLTINSADSIEDIADKLHEKGLINYPGLFKLYANIAVDDGEIAPGTYTLNTILDYHALVGQMSSNSSSRSVVEDVLIPEGYNCRQIFELLEQNGICTVAELEEYAANGEFQDFWFLEGLERGDKYCLEGFLFPDTYDFYAGSTPREALGKMLLGFEARIDQEEIAAKLVTLNERLAGMMRANGCSEEFIADNQISLYELLTVASLIEEETAGSSESPTIASVIYNRLTQNEVYERYLGIDAAIIYATGNAENIDTGIDSPYNTYTNAGLTPTPISNPGLSSINAALEFDDTDYYYYVLNPETQMHQFSKTYEEHQEWIEKFRGGDGE